MSNRIGAISGILLLIFGSLVPAFGLAELERATISDPRLENAFGVKIEDNVNVLQQVQISADVTNHQEKSQSFVYLVQIKDKSDFIVSIGWISANFAPDQKFTPSLSWTPDREGEYTAEIFVWEGFKSHRALSEYSMIQISVS